ERLTEESPVHFQRAGRLLCIKSSDGEGAEEVQVHKDSRTCCGVLKAWIGQAEFGLPLVVGSVVRERAAEPVGSRRTRPGHPSPATERAGAALRTADSRAVAA